MSEKLTADTINYDNVEPIVAKGSGAHSLYEVNPDTGGKTPVSGDEYLKGWGYDPKVRTSSTPYPSKHIEVTAAAETGTGPENYRLEAMNPENILELKDKFDQAFRKELELCSIKTDQDKANDPWLVESSAEHVRNKILREYLKIGERDWDQTELSEIRSDIIHMMSLSTKALESLVLKPTAAASEADVKPRVVIEPEPIVVTPQPVVVEAAPAGEAALAGEEAVASSEDENYQYKWNPEPGNQVIVKRGDGVFENDWTIDEVFPKDGEKFVRARKGHADGPHQTVVEPLDKFMQWQIEAGSVEDEEETELVPSPEDLPPSQDRAKSIFSKLKKLSPNAIILWMQNRGTGRDKDNKPIVVAVAPGEAPPEDPQTDEEKRKKRCWPLALGIGALALGAGYYLGKNGIPFVDIVGEGWGTPGPEAMPDGGGEGGHIEVFNHIEGDRSVQSILPDNLVQERTPGGFEHIIDKNTGQEVIDHVTYGENGRYSVDTIRELKDQGYDVGTKKIEIFDSTGPGPSGDITHKVSEVTS